MSTKLKLERILAVVVNKRTKIGGVWYEKGQVFSSFPQFAKTHKTLMSHLRKPKTGFLSLQMVDVRRLVDESPDEGETNGMGTEIAPSAPPPVKTDSEVKTETETSDEDKTETESDDKDADKASGDAQDEGEATPAETETKPSRKRTRAKTGKSDGE